MSNLNVNQECDWQVVNVLENLFTYNEISSYVIIDDRYMLTEHHRHVTHLGLNKMADMLPVVLMSTVSLVPNTAH